MDGEQNKTEPKLMSMLARDAGIIMIVFSAWAATDTWYLVSGIGLAAWASVVNAAFAGYVIGAIFHEWGHYMGAKLSGAKVPRIEPVGASLFRFNFDLVGNSLSQFNWMSYGGWVMHWALFVLVVVSIPMDTVGRIALASSIFGFIVFATILESGILSQTRSGAAPVDALKSLTPGKFRFAGSLALVSALISLVTFAD